MRMWMIDPAGMCRKHLLGEHVELHMLLGSLNKSKSISGFIENGLLEPLEISNRHDALVSEMLKRGYNHKSPLYFNISDYQQYGNQLESKVDKIKSLNDLLSRCPDCKSRHTS